MWNLSDVSKWFKYKTKEENIVNIGSLDYNKIVDFFKSR